MASPELALGQALALAEVLADVLAEVLALGQEPWLSSLEQGLGLNPSCRRCP